MKKTPHLMIALTAIGFSIAGCGGGSGTGIGAGSGTGAGSVGSFADLSSSFSSMTATGTGLSFTPEANMATGSATYQGVVNIGLGTGSGIGMRDTAFGALTVDVDFTGDTLSGSVDNFFYLDQSAASGSMTINNGTLTGNNTGIGDGLTADASGTVGGVALDMDVTGHFVGSGAEVINLYLDGKTDSSMGVGIGTQ